ncbi:MAG TPA: hypothetical protein VH164_12540, partial [Ktedonobacteraceae bacterium]|nr:hypothetical protein [Ktedonobacteraceae bacterium]
MKPARCITRSVMLPLIQWDGARRWKRSCRDQQLRTKPHLYRHAKPDVVIPPNKQASSQPVILARLLFLL